MSRVTRPRSQLWMLAATAVIALVSIIGSPFPDLAPLQNIPTLLVLAVLWLGTGRYSLTTGSVGCLCAFLLLHTIGGRYAYSYVPYDDWFHALGLASPSEVLDLHRNHYDRVVHFSFGALLYRPLCEILGRFYRVTGHRAAFLAIGFVLGASAAYEIFEWLLTLLMAPDYADTYNGQQGDMWDAQKDMALAFAGVMASAVLGPIAKSIRNHRT